MMGSKAFISLGEMYEVFVQVTATGAQGLNERNTVTILQEIIKKTMQDNACWQIKVKMDYEDSHSSEQSMNSLTTKEKINKNE